MKGRSLFLIVIAFSAVSAFAQAKTVTNLDLEKYRTTRVAAERELREDYARLGFPSPEVRAAREAEATKARNELTARLRAERLEREQLDAAQTAAENYSRQSVQVVEEPAIYGSGVEYGSYYWYGGRRFRRPQTTRGYQQPGYFAGGQFWPTGSAAPPQPLFRVRKK